MNPDIYYGNIVSHTAPFPSTRPFTGVTGSTITFNGFNLTGVGSITSKLDLLFYNRVNEIGEVLSSLVYVSNPLDPGDVTDKIYDVRKAYVNTDTERSMAITNDIKDWTYLNCKWFTSKFFTSSISPIADDEHVELPVNSIPSIKVDKYGVSFDGWYTQMSVGLRTQSSGTPPTVASKGLLGFHDFLSLGLLAAILVIDSPVDIDDDINWSPITTFLTDGTVNPDGSILIPGTSLANVLITLLVDNPYIKQDLFVIPTYMDLYNNAVVQYAEYPTYGNPFPVLRDKHRIIHDYAADNNYFEAQFILQSTEYFRAVTNQ